MDVPVSLCSSSHRVPPRPLGRLLARSVSLSLPLPQPPSKALGWHPLPFTDHCQDWAQSGADVHARKVLGITRRERPAAVHVFSNGGAFVWARALSFAAGNSADAGALSSVR